MISVMPPFPIFNDYHPPKSSPLASSSPIRASQMSSPPPLSPRDRNALPRRQVQSSPIQPLKFSFAGAVTASSSRGPVRPNPIVRSREGAQQNRRNLFLKGVQQRGDERRWERRGVENKLQSSEWFRETSALQRARETDVAGLVTDADISDAERLQEEQRRPPPMASPHDLRNVDEMMVDVMLQQEEAEIEALFSQNTAPEQAPAANEISRMPDSGTWSDDEDYDSLFAALIDGQPDEGLEGPVSSGDVEMG